MIETVESGTCIKNFKYYVDAESEEEALEYMSNGDIIYCDLIEERWNEGGKDIEVVDIKEIEEEDE